MLLRQELLPILLLAWKNRLEQSYLWSVHNVWLSTKALLCTVVPGLANHPFNFFVPIINLAGAYIDYYQIQAYNNWYDYYEPESSDYLIDVYLNWRNFPGLAGTQPWQISNVSLEIKFSWVFSAHNQQVDQDFIPNHKTFKNSNNISFHMVTQSKDLWSGIAIGIHLTNIQSQMQSRNLLPLSEKWFMFYSVFIFFYIFYFTK